jgi:hypothetical protein
LRLPALVCHADWSADRRKRWLAIARLQPDGKYFAGATQEVGPLESLWARLEQTAGGGPVLAGFDFPIGLPRAYACRARIDDFLTALKAFDERFYTVAERQDEICLDQPFYPMRRGGRSWPQLLAGLGLADWSDLQRRCDRRSATRPAACALFWTLGGQQVGKAAITGWRHLLAPSLRNRLDLGLWPFQGRLDELLARHRFVVTETYPAEFYRHLGLNLKGGKGKQAVRRSNTPAFLAWASAAGVDLDQDLVNEMRSGFGGDRRGDDRFDAVVGLFGMLNVVLGRRRSGEPAGDEDVRRIEGWILGQTAD